LLDLNSVPNEDRSSLQTLKVERGVRKGVGIVK